jgi:hypothetical protein
MSKDATAPNPTTTDQMSIHNISQSFASNTILTAEQMITSATCV